MQQPAKQAASTAPVPTLPASVIATGGAVVNPRLDLWRWAQGPYVANVNFDRHEIAAFRLELKASLIPFLRGHSARYVVNLFGAFVHFAKTMGSALGSVITVANVANYRARLTPTDVGRLGTLNALLQKWVEIGQPGVDPACADYLEERRKPGNEKGNAVATRDPVSGPFNEEEYTALHAAVNAAYGKGELPLWTLLLTRILFACGGRISQYAAMKIGDYDAKNRMLMLPQAKTGEDNPRKVLKPCAIAPQTGQLLEQYQQALLAAGYTSHSPLFPEDLVQHHKRGSGSVHKSSDPFHNHCAPNPLSLRFTYLLRAIAPPTERLDFAPMPINSRRFRYTYGTRLAEEGASVAVIASELGHVDLQNAMVYVSASPKIVDAIDEKMGHMLAPLAQAFRGRLIENEEDSTHKGALGSRIIDFKVAPDPVGNCGGTCKGCSFDKPVACYCCFKFEPWLDAPHHLVLERLMMDREKDAGDPRMAAINDLSIKAVREVIAECAEVMRQRAEEASKAKEAA